MSQKQKGVLKRTTPAGCAKFSSMASFTKISISHVLLRIPLAALMLFFMVFAADADAEEEAPASFDLLSPVDGVTLNTNPTLYWEESFNKPLDQGHYEIWVNGVQAGTTDAGTTRFSLPIGAPGENYEWYVVAVDASGNRTKSNENWTYSAGDVSGAVKYLDGFESGNLSQWKNNGMSITRDSISGDHSAIYSGTDKGYAIHSSIGLEDVFSGVESEDWRRISSGMISALIVPDDENSRPGIGFASDDDSWAYAALDPSTDTLSAYKRTPDGTITAVESVGVTIDAGETDKLEVFWSPYSEGMIIFLYKRDGEDWVISTDFRTGVNLPEATDLFFTCSGGQARFDDIRFDPTVDDWYYNWEWLSYPTIPDAPHSFPNVTVWKAPWGDNNFYMGMRGGAMFTSEDGLEWEKSGRCPATDDPTILLDPFGEEEVWMLVGRPSHGWYSSDGSEGFTNWTHRFNADFSGFGEKTQEIIDTRAHSQIEKVMFEGEKYRFINLYEVTFEPRSTVLLSNDLKNWVQAGGRDTPGANEKTWANKASTHAASFVQADGNIRAYICACTSEGYTGSVEATGLPVILDGEKPWEILKWGILPKQPFSKFGEWYAGANFPNEVLYDESTNTLWHFADFHDQNQGVMRVRNFIDQNPPAPPSELTASAIDSSRIALFWQESPTPDFTESKVDYYNVYRSKRGEFSITHEKLAGSPSLSNFADTGLAPGTTYYYKITAVDESGNESEPLSEVSTATDENN